MFEGHWRVGAALGRRENIAELGHDLPRRRRIHENVDPPPRGDRQRPQVVDPMGVIGVGVGQQHGVEPGDLRVDQLPAQVRGEIHQHDRLAVRAGAFDERRAAPAQVPGLVRVAGAPALRHARHAAGRAAAKDREAQAHALPSFIFLNIANVLARVAEAICSKLTPLASASARAVETTKAGSLRLPRWGTGAR